MNWVDFVIIGIISLSVLVSLLRGFVREVFSLLAWVVAVWLAFRFSGMLSAFLEPHVELPSARVALAFTGIFVVSLLIGGLINYLIATLIDKTGLSGTDRMLGMIFGLLRGLAILVVLVLILGLTPFPKDDWWRASRLMPYIEGLAESTVKYLPEQVAPYVNFDPVEMEKIRVDVIENYLKSVDDNEA